MKTIRLRDQRGVMRSFEGEPVTGQVPTISTRDDAEGKNRWVEMTLYRHADGGYVLHRNGKSLIYHRHPNTCGRNGERAGVKTRATMVPDEMIPCSRCRPPDPWSAKLGEIPSYYDVEEDRPIVDRCPQPEDVIEVLTEERGNGEPYLSKPARRLLEAVAPVEAQIRDVFEDEVPI